MIGGVILFIIFCAIYQIFTPKDLSLENQRVDKFTEIHKQINTRILEEKEFKIDNKPILGLKYAELINLWGKPNEIKKVKVYFSATVEPYYCYILKYDAIDIEMYPVDKNISVEATESFRFDITSSKYDFYGVKIGTSLSDYLKTLDSKEIFTVKEILDDTTGERIPFQYRKLLTTLKGSNYYDGYDKAIYEQVVIEGVPHGAIMLLKDDKVSRIVYGLPNAD